MQVDDSYSVPNVDDDFEMLTNTCSFIIDKDFIHFTFGNKYYLIGLYSYNAIKAHSF